MFPILFKIGPLTIRTYGFMVALGLFTAMQYIFYKTKQKNISEKHIMDLVLYTIVSGLIGARIFYVLQNWNFYSSHLSEIFMIWEGGLVFYGGFIAGIAAVVIYLFFHPLIKLLALADIFAPAIAIAHFFGRLGCFFAGCCYGKTSNLPWAVTFTKSNCLAPLNTKLHPVQIYEALGNLCLFFILAVYDKKYKHKDGYVFFLYLLSYGILRFFLEFLRGDERGSFFLIFSPGQVLSLILICISIGLFYGKRNFNNS